jgi:hypothetical protein
MARQPVVVEMGQLADLRGDKWDVQVIVYCEVGDIPWRVVYLPQNFGLYPLYDLCMGRLRTAPQLNTIRTHRFDHAFVQEKFVFKGEF